MVLLGGWAPPFCPLFVPFCPPWPPQSLYCTLISPPRHTPAIPPPQKFRTTPHRPRPPARPVPVRAPLWPDDRWRMGRPGGRASNREVGRPGARCWGRRYLPYRPPAPSGPAQASPGRPALALPHTTKPGPAAGRPQAGSARKCARRRLRFRVGATRQVNRLRPPARRSLTSIRPGRPARTTGRPGRRPGGTAYSTETLGAFSTPTEAATAYNAAAVRLFGPYARLNALP